MKTKTTLICSLPDQASVNIAEHILEIGPWKEAALPPADKMNEALSLYPITIPEEGEKETDDIGNGEADSGTPDVFRPPENESSRITKIFEQEHLRLIFLDGRHVFQDRLDKRLAHVGLPADRIVFLSKHKSRAEMRSLTVHPTGNVGKAILGGSSASLSVPDPHLLFAILDGMKNANEEAGLGYDVTLEVTHHGPTELEIPSLFVEIGSTDAEWTDPFAGKATAQAVMRIRGMCGGSAGAGDASDISEIAESKKIIAVGFGGGHYAERQTKWMLGGKILFGHIFPKHHMELLTEKTIRDAFEKSGASAAYFDKKSIKGDDRRRVSAIIEEMGYPILTDKDMN